MAQDVLARVMAMKAISEGGGGGTSDYNSLSNKPKINSVELSGNKPLSEFNIQETLSAGSGFSLSNNTINYDPDVLSTVDYVDGSISDTLAYIDQQDNSEHAGRVAGDNLLWTAVNGKQGTLTAGTNITIDENNVISASGGGGGASADEKTIITNSDGELETAIGGYKEIDEEAYDIALADDPTMIQGSYSNSYSLWYGKVGAFLDMPRFFYDYKPQELSSYELPVEGLDYIVYWKVNRNGVEDINETVKCKCVKQPGSNELFLVPYDLSPSIKFKGLFNFTSNNTILTVRDYFNGSTDKIVYFRVEKDKTYTYNPLDSRFIGIDNSLTLDANNKLSVARQFDALTESGNGVYANRAIGTNNNSGNCSISATSNASNNVALAVCGKTIEFRGCNGNIVACAQNRFLDNIIQNIVGTFITGDYHDLNNSGGAYVCNSTIEGYKHTVQTVGGNAMLSVHIEGNENTLSDFAEASHIEGYHNIVSKPYTHIQGKYAIQDTAGTYADIVGNGSNDSARSNAYTLDWSGNAVFAGTVSSSGSDYAEYFEWVDGNEEAEDRVGLIVKLSGDKIELANDGDDILGIVSGTATILGDNAEWDWQGKYLKDEFGRVIIDMVDEYREDIDDPEKQVFVGSFPHPRVNSNWNPEQEYVKRADRAEWDAVGMMGKLFVKDDGTAEVNGYVKANNGVATKSDEKTNMRVMSRVSDNIIRVCLK